MLFRPAGCARRGPLSPTTQQHSRARQLDCAGVSGPLAPPLAAPSSQEGAPMQLHLHLRAFAPVQSRASGLWFLFRLGTRSTCLSSCTWVSPGSSLLPRVWAPPSCRQSAPRAAEGPAPGATSGPGSQHAGALSLRRRRGFSPSFGAHTRRAKIVCPLVAPAGNLPWSTSKDELAQLFSQYGDVEDSFIPVGERAHLHCFSSQGARRARGGPASSAGGSAVPSEQSIWGQQRLASPRQLRVGFRQSSEDLVALWEGAPAASRTGAAPAAAQRLERRDGSPGRRSAREKRCAGDLLWAGKEGGCR